MHVQKKLVMITNKKNKGTLRCAGCMAIRLFSDKMENKYWLKTVVFQFLID